jgi:hypothetical protein
MARLNGFLILSLLVGLIVFVAWSDYQYDKEDPVVTETMCWNGDGALVRDSFCAGKPLEGGDPKDYHWVTITDRRSEIERQANLALQRRAF